MSICPECGASYAPHVRLCPRDGAVLDGGPAVDPQIGRTLDGKYRLDSAIGQGGMGAVYRATHLMLGKPLAVKLIKGELLTSGDVVRRFQREARAASALAHPNIAVVHDLGQTEDGTLYIVMEFIDGQSLKDAIRSGGRIDDTRIVRIAGQVARALAFAHEHQFVHRDLKPHNIMLARGPDGRELAKLLDFGIAKTFDEGATQLTATGSVLGTPQYMSPEQASGKVVDGRSDIYAFGIVLYEMLTGQVPFDDPSTPAVLVKHLIEPPERPSLRRSDLAISPALEAIALRCLEKDAAHRFQTAGEVADALDRSLDPAQQTPPLAKDTVLLRPSGVQAAVRSAGGASSVGQSMPTVLGESPMRVPTPVPEPVLATVAAKPKRRSVVLMVVGVLGALAVGLMAIVAAVALMNDRSGALPPPGPFVPLSPTVASEIGLQWARIPGGSFQMGCTPGDPQCYEIEKPRHLVMLDAFDIMTTEVTYGMYDAYSKSAGRNLPWLKPNNGGPRRPVSLKTWDEAVKACEWLGGRLPTEAEWERAARGGLKASRFPWGDEAPTHTIGAKNGLQFSAQDATDVGTFGANGFGLFDMEGNVDEWVSDWYAPYEPGNVSNPRGPATGTEKVSRGGMWSLGDYQQRVSERGKDTPDNSRGGMTGFRCARAVQGHP